MNDDHRKQPSVKFSGDRAGDFVYRLFWYALIIIIALGCVKAVWP